MRKFCIFLGMTFSSLVVAQDPECTEEICTVRQDELCDCYHYEFGRQFGNYYEDPTEEVDMDASWPSKRVEDFDLLFR